MKNRNNLITILYIFLSTLLVVMSYKIIPKHTNIGEIASTYIARDIVLVIIFGSFLRYALFKNNIKNSIIYDKLRNTNEELKKSNEKYDIVSKATSDIIWDWKINEDQMIWNKGIEAVFGYTAEQIGNSSTWWFDNIHPEDSIRMSIKLYSFIEQKTEKWRDQYRFKCADGTYKYVLDRGFILKDKKGKSVRMIGAIQDITKQKQEEQRLKLLETVITQTKDSIVITKPDSNDNSIPKIVYVNPAFSTMSGYESNEIIGRTPNLLLGPNSNYQELEKLSQAIKNKEECQVETICYKKNGEEYWVSFSMLPVHNIDNELTHWVSIQRNITAEKIQEVEKEQLIRELTQNIKNLQQFSYITSHNLRAPLSNLTGLLYLIEDIPIENEELKEILDGFRKSTHLLNDTINDLVRIIVIKDNHSFKKENVLIKDVFENVLSQVDSLIVLHKPLIKYDFEKVSFLSTNKAYLESILLNLLTNAIKYKSENRKLTINITANQKDDEVLMIFKDNGIGIDLEKNKDKIFGLYQRFHDFPDSKGLGLYLVKSQVETMGGTIKIESTVDVGTTFKITFKNNKNV